MCILTFYSQSRLLEYDYLSIYNSNKFANINSLIKLHGGQPANFLDVGGGATVRKFFYIKEFHIRGMDYTRGRGGI